MSEWRHIARHASTVLVGQLAVMAFGVTDTLVAGRHSQQALAALSVGSAVYISVFVALLGIVQALLPVWAELVGAERRQALGRSVRQSLYLAAGLCVPGMALLLWPDKALEWTQVPTKLRADVLAYLGVLALALPPALLFRMYSTLNQALHMPRLVTALQVGGLVLKIPLSIWWAQGGWGLEGAGATGCAWATLAVNYAMLAVAVWMLRRQAVYRPYQLWRGMERPDLKQIAHFLRLGVPAGLGVMVEVTSFTLMALLVARMGSAATASHQIAANVTAVLYMVPLSIAIASSARVSYWLGAGESAKAWHAVALGGWSVAAESCLLAALCWAGSRTVAELYTTSPEVARLAQVLLPWVALYHLADATQTFCVFVLRCWRITVMPLLIYGVMLWGVGLGGGYWLAYLSASATPPDARWFSPEAFWASSSAALVCTALLFVCMLLHTHRRHSTQWG